MLVEATDELVRQVSSSQVSSSWPVWVSGITYRRTSLGSPYREYTSAFDCV